MPEGIIGWILFIVFTVAMGIYAYGVIGGSIRGNYRGSKGLDNVEGGWLFIIIIFGLMFIKELIVGGIMR